MSTLDTICIKGGPKPPPNEKYIRLYSHPLDPYSQKARIALALKEVDFQQAYVDFPSRPEWFMSLASAGKIPVLELPGQPENIVYESKVVLEFIDEFFQQGVRLFPEDPMSKAQMRIFMIHFDEVTPLFYSILKSFGNNREAIEKMRRRLRFLEEILSENVESNYLYDAPDISIADVYAYPHVERIFYFQGSVIDPEGSKIRFKEFPYIMKWIDTIQKHPLLSNYITDKQMFVKWLESSKKAGDLSLSMQSEA